MEEPIDAAQIKASLRRSVIALNVVPVMCGSGLKDRGIQPLLDAVVDYLPSPMDMPPVQGRNPETGEPVRRVPVKRANQGLRILNVRHRPGQRPAPCDQGEAHRGVRKCRSLSPMTKSTISRTYSLSVSAPSRSARV